MLIEICKTISVWAYEMSAFRLLFCALSDFCVLLSWLEKMITNWHSGYFASAHQQHFIAQVELFYKLAFEFRELHVEDNQDGYTDGQVDDNLEEMEG